MDEAKTRIREGAQVFGMDPEPAAEQERLENSPLMAHLLQAIDEGIDIGDFGRLTFVMVGRFFLSDNELLSRLESQPGIEAREAQALLADVSEHDYTPPTQDQILEWQEYQEFPLCPAPEHPEQCDVYRDLHFPAKIYARLHPDWQNMSISATEN